MSPVSEAAVMPNTWDAPATKLKMDSGGGKKRGMSKQQGDSDNVMSCR